MTVTVHTPPTHVDWSKVGHSVFLAGSIENGAAPDWQSEMIELLQRLVPAHGDLTVFNPRRGDWNPKASQAELEAQILWELEALERADHIVMFYAANTVSPITLLEMGLHVGSRKLTVCCPSGFFRRTNVDIVCKRYGVVQVDTLADLAHTIIVTRDSKAPPTPIAKARKPLLIGQVSEDEVEKIRGSDKALTEDFPRNRCIASATGDDSVFTCACAHNLYFHPDHQQRGGVREECWATDLAGVPCSCLGFVPV
mgnify:FL=1